MVMLLGLLDMSAAFDIVDHKILLCRTEVSYGITGQVRQWLTSFLTDRTQVTAFAGTQSTLRSLLCGVPYSGVFEDPCCSSCALPVSPELLSVVESAFMLMLMTCMRLMPVVQRRTSRWLPVS